MLPLNSKTDVKNPFWCPTGNDDTPVNYENSSVGNFVIADDCEIILGNAQKEIGNDENLRHFLMPQFCASNYKGRSAFMFQGTTITGNVTV